MYILHHYLKSIKTSSLGYLNFLRKPFNEIFIDDAIGSSKKCQYMRYKVAFFISQFNPIIQILILKNVYFSQNNNNINLDLEFTFFKLTSSTFQNEASCFLYMAQISSYTIGNMTKRLGFSFNKGSIVASKLFLYMVKESK